MTKEMLKEEIVQLKSLNKEKNACKKAYRECYRMLKKEGITPEEQKQLDAIEAALDGIENAIEQKKTEINEAREQLKLARKKGEEKKQELQEEPRLLVGNPVGLVTAMPNSDFYLKRLMEIADELLVIIPRVEKYMEWAIEGGELKQEEADLLKKCYDLLEGGGQRQSYFGIIRDDQQICATDLKAFKKQYPSMEKHIFKIYPGIKVAISKMSIPNSVSTISEEAGEEVSAEVLKNTKINNVRITLHSAFWTEKFIDWLLKDSSISIEDLFQEVLRINGKDYKDEDSYKHALKHYECKGSVISVEKITAGVEIMGYIKPSKQKAMKIYIYVLAGGFIKIDLPELEEKTDEENYGVTSTIVRGTRTWVMKYSGWGPISRGVTNAMEGIDPYTGEAGSSVGLITGGLMDLATMGTKPLSAISGQVLNGVQEFLENSSPEIREELTGTKEIIDITFADNPVESVINVVQLLQATPELYDKYFGEKETEKTQNEAKQ